jgi:hypothetical protein
MTIFLIIIVLVAAGALIFFYHVKLGLFWKWITTKPQAKPNKEGSSLIVNIVGAGSVTLSINANITKLSKVQRDMVGTLIDNMQALEKKTGSS